MSSAGGAGGYAGAGLGVAGTILSAYAAQQQGQTQSAGLAFSGQAAAEAGVAQKQESDYLASTLNQQAGQARASSQQGAILARRNAAYVLSSAKARAAASGAGAADPTVVNVEGQIKSAGEYDALTQLYNGEEKARGLENEAALQTYQGNQALIAGQTKQQGYDYEAEAAKSAAQMKMFSTLLSGGSSLYSKYGAAFGGSGTDAEEAANFA